MKPRWLGAWVVVLALAAWAHRLDECLQAARIAVTPHRIDLALDLTPGVAVADAMLVVIDRDGNQRVSDLEAEDYAEDVLKDLRMELDGKPLRLELVSAVFPGMREVRAGEGVIGIRAAASVEHLAPGDHVLSLTNGHLPQVSVYLVNALAPKDSAIRIGKQTRDEEQRFYRLDFRHEPAR